MIKVRTLRSQATVEMLRESWGKEERNPFLRIIGYLNRPKLGIERVFHVQRPTQYAHSSRPFSVHLYFRDSEQAFMSATTLIYHIHGGGFVTMTPKCHESYVTKWASQTGFPIISINYGKAPEFPYPYALEECFDFYRALVTTNGECIGMKGWETVIDGKVRRRKPLRIIITGDSA
jgi:acetyl esterase/lipase